MKITAVKTVVCNAEMRNWVFVRVETDQAGLYGWGECSLEWKTRSVVGAVEDFTPMLLGEDPTRIEHLYQKLYRQSFWRVGVIGLSAISGIEQACWDIMVDCHGRHSLANALEFCRVLAPYRPYFVEEPVPPENVDVLAEVRRGTTVPISTGDRRITRYEFREIFEKQSCHVIQPDLCHCGGLWEAKKIAAMAEVYTMGVAPHNPLGPIANAVALHFDLSTPNFLIQEDMLADVPWRWEVVQHSLKSEGGYWLPNDAPGLGIEVDEAAAAKHPFQQEIIHATTVRAHDGAVLDW